MNNNNVNICEIFLFVNNNKKNQIKNEINLKISTSENSK